MNPTKKASAHACLKRMLFLFVSVAAVSLLQVGCGNSHSGGGSTFSTVVVIGDSLSAGFQNGSLLDSQQPNGWASLVAKQVSAQLALPLIAPPGAPNVLQLVSLGPPPVIQESPGLSLGRDDPVMQPFDLAVPGHQLGDVIGTQPQLIPTSSEALITDLVLGFPPGNGRSQMNEAIALNPTALFVWAGSNDALQADEAGTPSVMTPTAAFTQEFQQLLSTLHTQTKATLIVANIPDVTVVPYLTPAVEVIGEVAAATGLSPAQVAAILGIQPGDLVNATGLTQVQAAIGALEQGQAPTPLTDAGFLDPTEIATIQSTVAAYNAAIAQEVSSVGGTLVDINAYINSIAQTGVTINGYNATVSFLGGLFSLDGIHPTNTGYALIANQFIDAMNASMKTSITEVNVTAVAASDPLFGPNIKPVGAVRMIPVTAARRADQIITLCKAGCR